MKQQTVSDDFNNKVIQYISIEKVRTADLIKVIPFLPRNKVKDVELRSALMKLQKVIGNGLTELIIRYLNLNEPVQKKLNLENLDVNEAEQLNVDDEVFKAVYEYGKTVLISHLRIGKIIDPAQIAVGIRSITDVVNTDNASLAKESKVSKIYSNKKHYYVPLYQVLNDMILVILGRYLEIRIPANLEGTLLANLGSLAEEKNYNLANRNYTTLLNGDLDLETLEIVPFSADHFTTYRISLSPTENDKIPDGWQQFLDSQWGGDEGTQRWLVRYIATHLLPKTTGSVAIWWNQGSGGKSLLAKMIRHMLTSDGVQLTASAGMNTLTKDFGMSSLLLPDGVSTKLANLSDENDRAKFSFNIIKQLADVDGSITINRKNKELVTLKFNVQTTFLTNELPRSSDNVEETYGARRKINLLHFPKSFKPDEQDPTLESRMLSELNELGGVLLSELKKMKQEDIQSPLESESMIKDKNAWFASINEDKTPVAKFMREQVHTSANGKISRTELRNAFIVWSNATGTMTQEYSSPKRFKGKIKELYFSIFGIEYAEVKSNGVDYYLGIELNNEESEEIDDE